MKRYDYVSEVLRGTFPSDTTRKQAKRVLRKLVRAAITAGFRADISNLNINEQAIGIAKDLVP